MAATVTLAAPAVASPARETRLERRVVALRGKLDTVRGQRDDALRQLDAANEAVTRLSAGLPDAIRAVPISDFYRLVFTPARQAWPCDDFYQSGDFWSVSFQNRC